MGQHVVFNNRVKRLSVGSDTGARILRRICACFLILFTQDVVADEWNILVIRVDFPLEEPDQFTTTGMGNFDLRSPQVARADSDYALPYDLPPHDALYFDYHLQSLRRYYDTVSEGRVVIDYSIYPQAVTDAYTLPKPMLYYGNGRSKKEIGDRWIELLRDAFNLASKDVAGPKFSDFNSFLVIHAGSGHETGQLNDIRSVFLHASDFLQFNGGPLVVENIEIDSAWILPESPSRTGRGGLNGLMAKFFGNQLGLPGLSNFADGLPALGGWSLMDVGANALGFVKTDSLNPVVGFVPPHPMAWSKIQLGWIDPLVVFRDTVLSIAATDRNIQLPRAIRIPINRHEYFLLEYRRQRANTGVPDGQEIIGVDEDEVLWLDSSQIQFSGENQGVWLGVEDYDSFVPGSGLLIWHINKAIIDRADDLAFNNDPVKPGIALEEADVYRDIGQPVFERLRQIEGSKDDPFTSDGMSTFDEYSAPSSHSFDGWSTGIEVRVLSESEDEAHISVNFSKNFPRWPLELKHGSRLQSSDLNGDNLGELIVETTEGLTVISKNGGEYWNLPLAHFLVSGEIDSRNGDELIVFREGRLEAWHYGGTKAIWETDFHHVPESAIVGTFSTADKTEEIPILAVLSSGQLHEFEADTGILRLVVDNPEEEFNGIYATHAGYNGVAPNMFLAQGVNDSAYTQVFGKELDGTIISMVGGRAGNISINDKIVAVNDSLIASCSMGDVDGDGQLEGIFVGSNSIYSLDSKGISQANFPISMPMFSDVGRILFEPLLADLDGNGAQEIIVTTEGGIYAFDYSGRIMRGFPLLMSSSPTSAPTFIDINGDGLSELAALDSQLVYVWNLDRLNYQVTNVSWGQLNGKANGWRSIEGELDTVGVPQEDKKLMPPQLVYCYPNPVGLGEKAHMRFTVQNDADIELTVLDASGSSVQTITVPVTKGENEITWDVGSYVSGLYFCRIVARSDQQTETQIVKMAVLQ